MSRQLFRGSAGEYQADEQAGVARLHWQVYETHIFGFAGDLYGQEIEVDLKLKIRDERRFASIDELQRQLEKDAALCNPEL